MDFAACFTKSWDSVPLTLIESLLITTLFTDKSRSFITGQCSFMPLAISLVWSSPRDITLFQQWRSLTRCTQDYSIITILLTTNATVTYQTQYMHTKTDNEYMYIYTDTSNMTSGLSSIWRLCWRSVLSVAPLLLSLFLVRFMHEQWMSWFTPLKKFGLDVMQSHPPADVFGPIPVLISCAEVTVRWGLLSHA